MKISLPATILLASIILGGFYYASEANKQDSIERQQRIELQAKKDDEQAKVNQANGARIVQEQKENAITLEKASCVREAIESAKDYYKDVCTYDCKEDVYYIATYDSNYSSCLQRKGLK